ncbi:hypothetical protein LPB72_07235 [Hydrogenophaga crassostreae]|nr:hypothetical protein [Hydrogenophaga crassostreae]OAD42694.1 hypothetical protein LPB72_07235 [Hydrogenophaga crassostreae]
MSKKYNHLSKACHFQPFSFGERNHLHYSYTSEKMYCKNEISTDDDSFIYVEARELDEESKQQLNAMAAGDHIGPMQIFEGLRSDAPSPEDFQALLYRYRMTTTKLEELRDELKFEELDSDEYFDIEANIDITHQDKSEITIEIELMITAYNKESGYDWRAEAISHGSPFS